MEEDAFFESYGWWKNTVQRRWEAPNGVSHITFDDLMDYFGTGPEEENELRAIVVTYGERRR